MGYRSVLFSNGSFCINNTFNHVLLMAYEYNAITQTSDIAHEKSVNNIIYCIERVYVLRQNFYVAYAFGSVHYFCQAKFYNH